MPSDFLIRRAKASDSQSIFNLICELAVFEKAPDAVIISPQQLAKHGWDGQPYFICWVAELNLEVVGIALCYIRYSTWKGPVLYLEDLIVTENARNQGIGSALFESCLSHAQENEFQRLSWQVLDWNKSAIDFYEKYGATFDSEWVNCAIQTDQ